VILNQGGNSVCLQAIPPIICVRAAPAGIIG
jgi:hypothetical protein